MYIIYEIKGKKIGCTHKDKFDMRQYMQKHIGKMILLEEILCIYEASNREIELQKQYGYKVDKAPYWHTVQNFQPKSLTPEAIAKRVASTDWIAHAKKSHATVRRTKAGFKPVNVYKVSLSKKNGPNKIKTKKFYKKYDSLTYASKDLDIHTGSIHNVMNPNHVAKSVKGYTFEYIQ